MLKVTIGIVLCTALTSLGILDEKESNLRYSGSASDKKTNALYYVEEHEELKTNGVHCATSIQYKNDKGEVIVFKTIDYTKGYTTPSFKQEDKRDGHLEAVEFQNKKVKLFYKKSRNAALQTETIEAPENLVIDGGFNYFVKTHWDEIYKGNTVSFNFVVPAEMDYFAFRVKKVKEEIKESKKYLIVKMESDNFVIRSLMDPIMLTYNVETHRLVKYEGVSNINDVNGKRYVVKITYPTVGP